jgi:enoyl-CoA hydratase/carnithine racemase
MNDEIQLQIGGGKAVLTINRPQARNALNSTSQRRFAEIVDIISSTNGLRIVIITASGHSSFVSGGDIKEIAANPDPETGEHLNRVMGSALHKLTSLPFPVLAAVNGDAIGGGCEILTACDLRMAVPHARFRFAEITVALTTGWGGTARLFHLIGLSRTLDLLLTGRFFGAKEALDIGFVNRLVPEGENVLTWANKWADELIRLPRHALAAAKELAWASASMPLEEVLSLEKSHFINLWLKSDHREALQAFADKRSPEFNQKLTSS